MLESLSTLLDLFTRPDFLAGVVAGIVGAGLLYGASRSTQAPPLWGIVFTTATIVAIDLVVSRHLSVTVALVSLAAGGWLLGGERRATTGLAGWAAIVFGAVLIGLRGGLDDLTWLPWAAPVAILIAGWCLATWSSRLPPTLVGPMMAVAAFGVWVTVPETEHARALLGVAIPLALGTLTPIRARLSTAGAFALAGVFVWVVAIGGDARPGSIIGGWGCLGVLAILPWVRPDAADLVARRPWAILATHTAFVVISSRLIGLWESAVMAAVALLVLSVLTFVVAGSLTGSTTAEPARAHGPE